MTDFTKMSLAIGHLGRQLENLRTARDRAELSDLDREAIQESVIQRFETAYDVTWKTLRRVLNEQYGIPELPNSPKPILRIAGENGLLPGSVAEWIAFADARTATAHDYDLAKAEQTVLAAHEFHRLAEPLIAKLIGGPRS